MIQSMTGFGKAVCELSNKKIHVEIKSLNSKQLDLNAKMPNLYREKELELRNLIAASLQRGKVELNINVENLTSEKNVQLNEPVITNYYQQLTKLAHQLNDNNNSDYLRIAMSLPDTLKVEQNELDENEWAQIIEHTNMAIEAIQQFRRQEGDSLEADIKRRASKIGELLQQVEPLEKLRVEKIKTRIKDNLNEVIDKSKIDENRFEQELIFYIEKLDISEEKVRLSNHIKYFYETIQEDQPVGKKLGFITQEMGREINTLGSKANDAEMQRIVIQMKDELEKIKEQVLNIL
ncbi:YicC/YloC family endoribonuclease [Geofilum sp. OHC36d9]|uniref:YicC/YloC family endoribonuclease n=1 Tax=Geofilum sp. OHC36d9 TaxID=3458413 RepID=UPI0040342B77